MSDQLTARQVLCRMAEYDLLRNINEGSEYIGFKKMYNNRMLPKTHISQYGIVYDITDPDISGHHLLNYLRKVESDEQPSEVVMTSGSFLSMNQPLQEQVTIHLKKISEEAPVRLYAGDSGVDFDKLFSNSKVKVKNFKMGKHFIIHFIKTEHSFNFVMPHTEDKKVRVDLNSDSFKPQNVKRILSYFDRLVTKFDKEIEFDNKAEK